MKKTKGILVCAGTAILGMAYIPATKPLPDPKVAEYYLNKAGKYSGWSSEQRRKEILSDIRRIRTEIRKQANAQRMENKGHHVLAHLKIVEDAGKICNEMFQSIWMKTEEKVAKIVQERAKELNTQPQYIKVEQLCKRKGIILLHLEDIS